MYPPKYWKCLVNVMMPRSPISTLLVSCALSYMLSCRLRFRYLLSCFGLVLTGRSDGSVGSVTEGSGGGLKYPGAGKKTHSVFGVLFAFPTCISSPNRSNCLCTTYAPISRSRLDTNANAPSSTYNIQKVSNSVPFEKFFVG